MDATTAQHFGQRGGGRTTAAGYDGIEAATPAGAELGERVTRGTVAGLAAGLLFLVANMLLVPLLRNIRTLAAGAVAFGVALYLINFQILGRTAFPWFQEGPDQLFELVAHAGFGLLLVPFFIGRRFTAMRGQRAT